MAIQCTLCGGELRMLPDGNFCCAACGAVYPAEVLQRWLKERENADWEWRTSEEGVELTAWNEDREEALVPEQIDGRTVVALGERVFYGKKQLRRAVLPDGIRAIGRMAFCKCLALEEVRVPAALERIGSDAFTNCRLRDFSIPEGVTALDNAAFSGCERLEEVLLPAGLREVPLLAFCGCKSLRRLALPAGLERICDSAFCGCASLETVELPEGLREIGIMAFWGGERLGEVRIPASVERVGELAFYRSGARQAPLAEPHGPAGETAGG